MLKLFLTVWYTPLIPFAFKTVLIVKRTANSNLHCTLAAGISYTDDKMLQTRIFSYADTQRHRLGPNYLMLPVNAPK